jgi:hypothetical protein
MRVCLWSQLRISPSTRRLIYLWLRLLRCCPLFFSLSQAIDDKLAELARQPNNSMYPTDIGVATTAAAGGGTQAATAAAGRDGHALSSPEGKGTSSGAATAAAPTASASPSQSQSHAQTTSGSGSIHGSPSSSSSSVALAASASGSASSAAGLGLPSEEELAQMEAALAKPAQD